MAVLHDRRTAVPYSVCRGVIASSIAILAAAQIAVRAPSAALAEPFVEQAELLGHGSEFGGGGGAAEHDVALSADGNTALVGAPLGSPSEPSYALIFTRSGSTWSQPTPLVPEVEPGVYRVPTEGFGSGVALSVDGNLALVGDKVYPFTKEGAGWHSTGRIEGQGREGVCGEGFGEAVAVSEDGNTAIFGGPGGCPEDFDGSAFIYSRSGSAWTRQAGPLHGGEKVNGPFGNTARFAKTVAISGDGNTAIVGAPGEEGGLGCSTGGAWVYRRSGSTWVQDGPKLIPPGDRCSSFGRSVALSGDGTRALVGESGDESHGGSGAWIFDRGPSGWTAQTRLESGESSSVNGSFGWTVALSRSGNTALIGGPETGPAGVIEAGEAWAFRCSAAQWIREPILPPALVRGGNFGYSVALASNGTSALVGAPGLPGGSRREGAAFVFTAAPVSPEFCAGKAPSTGNSRATAPTIESLRQTHSTWREGKALASLARRHSRIPIGTTFDFSLNEPSRVRFSFTQVGTGRIRHGRCTHGPPRGRRTSSCQLSVGRGSLLLSANGGARRLRFFGRMSKRRLLPLGSYTVTLTAEAAGKKAAPLHLSFRIVA